MFVVLLCACAHNPAAIGVDVAPGVVSAPVALPIATVTDKDGALLQTPVAWSVADPSVADVSGGGIVPLRSGTTELIASAGGVSARWKLEVAMGGRIVLHASLGLVDPRLDRSVLDAELRRIGPTLQACSAAPAALDLGFDVDPSGAVGNVHVDHTTGGPEVGACLATSLGGMHLPSFAPPPAHATLRLEFVPG